MAKFEKQKYPLGTLVELSAAGSTRQQNYSLVGGFGIVIGFEACRHYPYTTKWMKDGEWIGMSPYSDSVFKGYEIKKLKTVKK